jgi:hypothetical protein
MAAKIYQNLSNAMRRRELYLLCGLYELNLAPLERCRPRLGISLWTLRKKAYDGDIASLKIGVKLLIPGTEIELVIRDETKLDHLASAGLRREIPTDEGAQRSTGSRQNRR